MRKLHTYQWPAVSYIIEHKRCNLLMAMGLGKTVTTLTAIDTLSLTEEVYPVLVLGPLRVISTTWPDEVKAWPHLEHMTVSVVTGSKAERLAALRVKADIFCMNYENLVWLEETLGDTWPFKMIVADECSKLKGFRLRQGSKRAQALARYVHDTPRYVGLTGTPASNGLIDLWAIMWMVDKGERLARSFNAFSQRWFRSDYSGFGLIPLQHSQAEIQEKIADVCLSLNAADYFDLSEPIVNKIMVTLPSAARKSYDEMEKQMFTSISGDDVEAFNAAAKTMKCLQLANGAVYTDDAGAFATVHDEKIAALESVIEEACGAPVLVAYHFKSDLERLQKAFPKARVLDSKPQTIKDFNAGKIDLLLAHPASAGHGINLAKGGSILAFFSLNWNLEEHMQIIERIGPTRQAQLGSGRAVYIHYILAKDTIDAMVLERLTSKKSVQEILLNAMNEKSK